VVAIRYAFVCIMLLVWTQAKALPVRHLILDTDSASSIQLQGACSGADGFVGSHHCNPALSGKVLGYRLVADVIAKLNEQAFNLTNRILFEKMTKEYLQDLFEENDFQSFAALLRLESIYENFSLTYVPVHAVAAFKVANPNLPEISAGAMRQSLFRVQSSAALTDKNPVFGTVRIGASVFYRDISRYEVNTDVLGVALEDENNFVKEESSSEPDMDFGMIWLPAASYLPTIGLVVRNSFGENACGHCESPTISVRHMTQTRSKVDAGYSINSRAGQFYLGLAQPFAGIMQTIDSSGHSIAIGHRLGHLQSFVSGSPMMQSFGFLFDYENYMVGIQYTNEKQENAIQLERQKDVYLYLQGSI